jgi:phosphatidylinositol-3-phosphatase
VFLIVFENKDPADVVTQGDYFASLADRYASAVSYRAVAHPSQPNYLALFSGSTHGVEDNEPHDIDAPSLADQVEAAGLSWRVYAENFPGDCFTGATAEGGPDGEGVYARKHNPAISFTAVTNDPDRCASIMDLSHFDPEAAEFSLIVPNNCHSTHDCSIGAGDAWLKEFMPRITHSAAFADGAVVFITFDEDDGGGDNLVEMIAVSQRFQEPLVIEAPYDHYSLLRTVEELLGLPCMAQSCQADPIRDVLESVAG